MAGNHNSGRKPKSLNRANAKRRLAALDPKAVDVIEDTMTGKNEDKLQFEAARFVYEQNHGKATIPMNASGEVTLTVKRDR